MDKRFEAIITGNFLVTEDIAEEWLDCSFFGFEESLFTIQQVKHKKLDGIWYLLRFNESLLSFDLLFDSWLTNRVYPHYTTDKIVGGVYVEYTNMNEREFVSKVISTTKLESPIHLHYAGSKNSVVVESILQDLWAERNDYESYDLFVDAGVEITEKLRNDLTMISEDLYDKIGDPFEVFSTYFARKFFENIKKEHCENV